MNYQHLSQAERHQIHTLLIARHTILIFPQNTLEHQYLPLNLNVSSPIRTNSVKSYSKFSTTAANWHAKNWQAPNPRLPLQSLRIAGQLRNARPVALGDGLRGHQPRAAYAHHIGQGQ